MTAGDIVTGIGVLLAAGGMLAGAVNKITRAIDALRLDVVKMTGDLDRRVAIIEATHRACPVAAKFLEGVP
jgi:hypothetical protein